MFRNNIDIKALQNLVDVYGIKHVEKKYSNYGYKIKLDGKQEIEIELFSLSKQLGVFCKEFETDGTYKYNNTWAALSFIERWRVNRWMKKMYNKYTYKDAVSNLNLRLEYLMLEKDSIRD